jgi:hypothetical protein
LETNVGEFPQTLHRVVDLMSPDPSLFAHKQTKPEGAANVRPLVV